ncbi:TPA: hypothetical protein ACPO4H_000533 [Haemophilus influenzae]|nr:hypothetical protein [Haemophilus influenzae]MCK8943194.1 hypothetical protein [Haemophilus influenzae]
MAKPKQQPRNDNNNPTKCQNSTLMVIVRLLADFPIGRVMHRNLTERFGGILATGFDYAKARTAGVNHGDRPTVASG